MSTKVYADESVYDAALRRLEFVFARFERVYLSVSFGKDSSVMMQLALRVARRLGKARHRWRGAIEHWKACCGYAQLQRRGASDGICPKRARRLAACDRFPGIPRDNALAHAVCNR